MKSRHGGPQKKRRICHSKKQPATRPATYRVRPPMKRRPMWRPRGRYPRLYRAKPMSSGGCLVVFLFIAIILLFAYAPTFSFVLALEYSFALILVGVVGLFILAILFITKADIGGDDGDDSTDGGTTRVIERERILVVCPYCGAKNEQGLGKCQNCDGEL